MSRRPIVAIDGPAGAGKSTVASHLAKRFGLLNLETGAMYRALALKCLSGDIDLDSSDAVFALTDGTAITLELTETGNRVLLNGVDVTTELRTPAVTQAASRVSVHPPVRKWMVAQQRALGINGGVVMEGRDIGTDVFPDADVKIFLDASSEARGNRRYEQIAGRTTETREATIAELQERDTRDRSRATAPLRAAEDAVVVDTTEMTLDEVLARAEELVLPFVR